MVWQIHEGMFMHGRRRGVEGNGAFGGKVHRVAMGGISEWGRFQTAHGCINYFKSSFSLST